MASALYTLLSKGFDLLSPFRWHQEIAAGRLQLQDPNEVVSDNGLTDTSLLEMVAEKMVAPLSFGGWKATEDDGRFEPATGEEDLVLFLIDQGANPWRTPQQGDNYRAPPRVFDCALSKGWTKVVERLVRDVRAPSRAVLEQWQTLRPFEGSSAASTWAPVNMARLNQVAMIQAWAALGFSLACPVEQAWHHPLAHARTPEFIDAWFKAGGGMDGLEEEAFRKSWHVPAAQELKLLHALRRHCPKHVDTRPVSERIDQLLREEMGRPTQKTKAMFLQAVADLGLKLSSVDENGRSLAQCWLARVDAGQRLSASVETAIFMELSPAEQEQALVRTLKLLGQPSSLKPEKMFPPKDVIGSWLRRQSSPAHPSPAIAQRLASAVYPSLPGLEALAQATTGVAGPHEAWSQWVVAWDQEDPAALKGSTLLCAWGGKKALSAASSGDGLPRGFIETALSLPEATFTAASPALTALVVIAGASKGALLPLASLELAKVSWSAYNLATRSLATREGGHPASWAQAQQLLEQALEGKEQGARRAYLEESLTALMAERMDAALPPATTGQRPRF